MSDSWHVYPLGDLVEHDTETEDAACVCGPTIRPATRDDGSMGWIITHSSFDGRELDEGDAA